MSSTPSASTVSSTSSTSAVSSASTSSTSGTTLSQDQKNEQKKLRVNIGIPGNKFSGNFMISIIQSIYELWRSGSYDVSIVQGHNTFSPHSRMNTLGLDVLKGKDQKPFNNTEYDVFVTIDPDVVFSPDQLILLIESTKKHPVVSGYYKMANGTDFSVVKEMSKEYFKNNGTYEYIKESDLEPYVKRFQDHIKNAQKLKEESKESEIKPYTPEYIQVVQVKLAFFACTKQVLDDMKYPYFSCDVQKMRGKDGVELLEICNDEVAFCKNVGDAGYDIMVNTLIRVGHESVVIM
jgi:hypothetical protein